MLKYTFEKEADIPAEVKGHYVEKEIETGPGQKAKLWVLDCEDVVPKWRFVEFRSNNEKLFKENKDLKANAEGIDDFGKARQLMQICKDMEVVEAEKVLKKGGVDGIVEARTKAMRDDYEGKLAKANSDLAITQRNLEKHMLNSRVLGAAAQFKLRPGAEAFILQMAESVFRMKDGELVALDASGSPIYSKDGQTKLGIAEWVSELPKKWEYLFEPSSGGGASGGSAGGAGSSGAAGTNPWKKETFNLTEQGKILKQNPELAARLQAQAGKRVAP